jgi:hypothetical protein
MTERQSLLESIATTIKTYRKGELPEPTAQHVDRWVSQFTPINQLAFLREFDHVMKSQFITKKLVKDFLRNLITNEKLSGTDPKSYWLKANVLDIQKDGQSQSAMVEIFDKLLQEELGISLAECGQESSNFIYLDDVIFSGGRVGADLGAWIKEKAPAKAVVQVIVIAWHTLGRFHLGKNLAIAVAESKKSINFAYWRLAEIENRKSYKGSSEVLWPTEAPSVRVVNDYLALPHKFPFDPRTPGAAMAPFSSEAGRQILEREFVIAGAQIRSQGQVADVNRPLGHGFFGLGFGATVVTYRNCPNNCPLALWWGNPDEVSGALKWYPLLARKNYSSAENVFGKLFK